jgi:SAM-dependent methyltransferase
MDVRSYNREAWNREVEGGNRWTVPVSPEEIAAARGGEWSILLTPTKSVPREWFPELKGRQVLCLASGGGQQGPLMAAAGAHVTVFDNSPRQLRQDRLVAEREGLALATVEGDMADLSAFPDESFHLIIHPISNVFAQDVLPVWREAYRVLKPGGALLAGFMNPVIYLFDFQRMEEQGEFDLRYSLPYSDLISLPEEKKAELLAKGWPLEFGHTLEDQIGGQLKAGFLLAGFYEDIDPQELLCKYTPVYLATRAIKPAAFS